MYLVLLSLTFHFHLFLSWLMKQVFHGVCCDEREEEWTRKSGGCLKSTIDTDWFEFKMDAENCWFTHNYYLFTHQELVNEWNTYTSDVTLSILNILFARSISTVVVWADWYGWCESTLLILFERRWDSQENNTSVQVDVPCQGDIVGILCHLGLFF